MERRDNDSKRLAQEILDFLLKKSGFVFYGAISAAERDPDYWTNGLALWQSCLFCTSVSALGTLAFYSI